jgi:putative transposase
MKKKKQTKYSSAQKAKIALEAIKEEKTLSQIGSEYDVIPRNVFNWNQ